VGQPPPEYLELILCRDVYHCTPVALAEVPMTKVLTHLTCLSIEGDVANKRRIIAEQKYAARR